MERKRRPWFAEFTKATKRDIKIESGNRCQICGGEGCEVHHKIPYSHGGTRDPDNAVCLCPFCHLEADNLALYHDPPIYYPENIIFILEKRANPNK